jgi:hypothetical protein
MRMLAISIMHAALVRTYVDPCQQCRYIDGTRTARSGQVRMYVRYVSVPIYTYVYVQSDIYACMQLQYWLACAWKNSEN